MSTGTKALLALFGVACLAVLGWLMNAPAVDEAVMRTHVEEIRARKAPPIEPLPFVREPRTTPLAMERDPFE